MAEQIVTFSNSSERNRWDEFVIHSPYGHLMQTCQWGDFKAALGWRVQRLGLECQGQIIAGAQLFIRTLPGLPFTIAYIPKGPIIDLVAPSATRALFQAIHQAARYQWAAFLKIEPNLPDDTKYHHLLQQYGFRRSSCSNQPRSTLVIDLSGGEEVVLAAMRRKTRQLIRRAANMGVEVIESYASGLPEFYQVLQTTADKKGFPIHDKIFYEQAWQTFSPSQGIKLFLAKYQGQTVAAKLIFVFGRRSLHLFGGTSTQGRAVDASYLIQWHALKWAIAQGYHTSDLWGIPDEIATLVKNKQELPKENQGGLWGVYNFKRGFGGEIETYVGAYDYPYWPWLYYPMMKIFRNHSVDTLSHWLEILSR